jgi:HEAT repeat protein
LTPDQWAARAALDDAEARQDVAINMATFGPSVLCYAEEWMQSPNASLRYNGAELVRMIGPEGGSAVTSLRTLLRDPVPNVRVAAARALTSIGPHAAAPSAGDLRDLLEDENPFIRYHACRALESLGRHGEPALHPLAELTHQDRDRDVREAAAAAHTEILRDLRTFERRRQLFPEQAGR